MTITTGNAVDIGLEKTEYTVDDNTDYQVVCAEVQSGSLSGRSIEIRYIVLDTGRV